MLSGLIGAGAQEGLEELLVRQLKEQMAQEEIRQAKAREAQNARRLDLDERRQAFGERVRQEDIEQSTMDSLRANNDRMDARLTRLNTESANEQAERDRKAALDALLPMLPPNVRQAIEAQNAGVTGIKPDDLKSPEQRKADDDAAVERAGRIAGAQAAAAAKFRPKPEPKPTGVAGMTSGQLQTAKQFQDDYARDSKTYLTVRNAYQQVKGAADKPDAAGDLSLIFGYMKMLDPNSVVRETEFANAQNAAGIPDQIRNVWNRALRGERLNPNQRQQFVGQARRIWESAHGNQGRVRKTYGDRATKFGIDPTMVLDDEEPLDDVMTKEQVNQKTGARRTLVSTDGGKTWQVKQ